MNLKEVKFVVTQQVANLNLYLLIPIHCLCYLYEHINIISNEEKI